MGTNYYWHPKRPCPTCMATRHDPIHIGKSSLGWCFALHVYPRLGIHTLQDWEPLWESGYIYNEDKEEFTHAAMVEVITERGRPIAPWERDHFFYRTEEELHQANHSERGPNNLLRYKVDGKFCVGHGVGTWDLIQREFE